MSKCTRNSPGTCFFYLSQFQNDLITESKTCGGLVSSVQLFSRVRLFVTPWTAACQASLSITNSRSSLKLMSVKSWCHPTISSSVVPFSCLQSFPASGSFPVCQFFTSGGQSSRVSASASVLPMNIQDWFPLGWTGWISLQFKGLSRVFSNTTVQKHQLWHSAFFIVQLSHPYMSTGKKPYLWLDGPCWQSNVSAF